MSEADELKMLDGFFTMAFSEDTASLRTWSPGATRSSADSRSR
jgi:hypothetical protein